MRASAAQLRYRAEEFSRVAGSVDAHVQAMTFAGPAADRWRAATGARSTQLRSLAARMQSSAELLARSATLVEETRTLEALLGESS